jgi:hypothetical protein
LNIVAHKTLNFRGTKVTGTFKMGTSCIRLIKVLSWSLCLVPLVRNGRFSALQHALLRCNVPPSVAPCCSGAALGVQEWLTSAITALMLPSVGFLGASLNAKTVRALLSEFQTLYVLVNFLATCGLLLFLFRDHPAKMVAGAFWLPGAAFAGFVDAYVEGGRVITSRVFFTLNIACAIFLLLLASLKLGAFTDYTFELGAFAFVASSMACSPVTTALVFGVKNFTLSFFRPGSLVVLTSAVCCLFLDADTLAVLKAAYSLQGQSFGKYTANRTVQMRLDQHRISIAAAASALVAAANSVAPDGASAAEMRREYEPEPRDAIVLPL